ncbi:DUF4236 domain-containing protein [Corynebacterium nuruki]|uniref:DUF4236 domain-containing protein n=1 Tax=Corynebacterium nuruki TaxID=1032851 RepID=UPI0039BF4526
MGIYFRNRQKTGKDSWINCSGSGASMSRRFGPVTVNSRGTYSIKLPGGMNIRGNFKKKR